jgi:transcriptional regulator with XRE-family HTH domain
MPNLRTARVRAKLTQAQLAEKANVGRATISKLEAGRTTPQPETARRLAQALKINLLQLRFDSSLTGDGQPTTNGKRISPSNGIVEQQADGRVRILLGPRMDKEVQVALFGLEPKHLNEAPEKGPSWRPGTAENMVHLRELPVHAMAVLGAVDAPPDIFAVTTQALVLACVWGDWLPEDDTYCQNVYLLHLPWSLVLCVDSQGWWEPRITEGDSDDRAQ